MNKLPLVILTGPTAVGKTELSLKLAKAIGGEIISADSMQVYRYMDIGTAKIMSDEMQDVPHHLIDVLEPEEAFNVYTFQKMAKECMAGIYSRGHIPVVVGGTGFYIQALLYDIDFTENDTDLRIRHELEQLAAQKGSEYLHEMLRKVDPASAESIHANNVKRVIRALEYFKQTGETMSEHNARESSRTSAYQSAYFVLTNDRKILYDRIDRRVDRMLADGLVKEVSGLKERGYDRSLVSMQGLGYKEILDYLDGECTLDEAVYTLKKETRHFAKRQLTWFKRERDVIWLDRQIDPDEHVLLDKMITILKNNGIIPAI